MYKEFELMLDGLPEDQREKIIDITEELMVEWFMAGEVPEDADDIIFEKVNEIMENNNE